MECEPIYIKRRGSNYGCIYFGSKPYKYYLLPIVVVEGLGGCPVISVKNICEISQNVCKLIQMLTDYNK